MLVNVILFLFILFLLVCLSMIWPPDSPWAPWWRTDKKIARAACLLAKITSKDVVYELGSGDGTFLTVAVKEFGAKGVGIEIDPLRFFISKILTRLNGVSGDIEILKGNFFQQDLSEATVIFVYLVPKTLERLKPKFLKELRPGTKIISLRYKVSLQEISSDKNHSLYLYKAN